MNVFVWFSSKWDYNWLCWNSYYCENDNDDDDDDDECVCVCFFVPYARPQFWADLHEIWHVASLFPPDGRGRGFASTAWARGLTLHAQSIHHWKLVADCGHLTSGHKTTPSGNSELAAATATDRDVSTSHDSKTAETGIHYPEMATFLPTYAYLDTLYQNLIILALVSGLSLYEIGR